MRRKYVVRLSKEERKYASELLSNAERSNRYRRRANVLLMADRSIGKPLTLKEIAARCGVDYTTVYNIIRDYCENGIERTLHSQRPPNKPIVSEEAEERIIALACEDPPEGFSRWTVRLLTKKVVELSIVSEVSRETIRNILIKRNISLT